MAKKLITKTPEQFKAAIKVKLDAELQARVDKLYNNAVDAINAEQNVIDVPEGDLDILPTVADLLMNQGFTIVRYLGSRALIRTT